MEQPGLAAFLPRFWLAVAASMGAGWLAFGWSLFDRTSPAFLCATVGALAAAIITLVRLSRPLPALALAVGFGLFRLGWVQKEGWVVACSGFVIAGGLFLVALIFEMLRRRGLQFGKFLVIGPLIGGVFLAAAPLAEFRNFTMVDAAGTYLRHAFVGVVMGDAVGLGVELVDLVSLALGRSRVPLAKGPVSPAVGAPTSERE